MAAEQPETPPPDAGGPMLSRRRLLKAGAGAAAGGALATGAGPLDDLQPVGGADAFAVSGTALLAGGTAVAIGAGIGYLAGSSSGPDKETIESTMDFEKHLEIYNKAQETYEIREQNVLTTMHNNAVNLRKTARENAVFKIVEAAASGLSASEAESRAQTAIDETYKTAQNSLLLRYAAHTEGLATEAFNLGILELSHDGYSDVTITSDVEKATGATPTFVDGSTTSGYASFKSSSDTFTGTKFWTRPGEYTWHSELWITEPVPSDYGVNSDGYDLSGVDGPQKFADFQTYFDVWALLKDEHSNVSGEVSSLVDNHYQAVVDGDVGVTELLAPSSMIETSSNADSYQEAALVFNSMGVPKSEPVMVEFEASDSTDSTTTTTDSTVEAEGILAWSLADQAENPLPVGSPIDPANYPGEIMFATEYQNDSGETVAEVVEIIEPFTITATESGADSVPFATPEMTSSDTTTQEAIEILRNNRKEEQAAREATTEIVIGGSGGGLGVPSLPSWIPGSGLAQWAIVGGGALIGVNLLTD